MSKTLPLSPDELLTTTRAVRRRLDLDRPVPLEEIEQCVRIALQAPSGSNSRRWHFVVVSDAEKRAKIADFYRESFADYRKMPISAHALAEQAEGTEVGVMNRVVDSAESLAENLHRVPALVIPCIEGRLPAMEGPMGDLSRASHYGSILPAFWSFMLAARARGLGTAWTTLHLRFEVEIAELLDIPYSEIMQCALSPVAYTQGTDFKAASGREPENSLHVDGW
ncbi:nitroreductase family protein [Myxococcota bacterium]|nr:nitroreductase family protein [Myxococcota bacterium]